MRTLLENIFREYASCWCEKMLNKQTNKQKQTQSQEFVQLKEKRKNHKQFEFVKRFPRNQSHAECKTRINVVILGSSYRFALFFKDNFALCQIQQIQWNFLRYMITNQNTVLMIGPAGEKNNKTRIESCGQTITIENK